ncbi:AraC family transcriptional regulator [Prevotella intermedia ATCC 25611 = DSM 20706]|uniref:hybrid sensor histidine kinase/response regulator transcription factor n=1 Tax=Prevotella intermedia TaxID=28131 RepID=UPI0003F99D23|nr:substrate-binding domain-containing protein [Prevotella intermedia]APW31683.1 AraC family transcriptional regulator [Prevotella intermedia ATCC 25611 = DSM 20706]SUB96209.1 Alkaline phosphatase synthesis sensor protein phoR [Prevotella intermedia]
MYKKAHIVLCFVGLLVLAGCNRNTKKYVIGVSQCSEDIWRNKLNDELLMETYQHKDVELLFASAKDNDKLQTEQIEKFIQRGVDLLIISPNQVHSITPVIDKAYDKGIPVILFDRKTDSQKYTAFIGADNVKVGKTIGEFIAKTLHGEGKVIEIKGLDNSSPAIDRHKGFVQALSRYPDIHLKRTLSGEWTKESGYKSIKSAIADAKDCNIVWGQNDRMAEGAQRAMAEAGVHNVQYVGTDALPSKGGGIEAVHNGKLLASYIYPTRGDMVMQLAMRILKKQPFHRDNYLKGALVTKDNAKVLLLQNEEMMKQRSRLSDLNSKVDIYLAQYNHQKIYMFLGGVIIALLIGLIVYIYRTIILRRELEEQATNAKLQFFTNISHELRTPLTLIADPIEHIVNDKNLTKQQRNMLQIVEKNVSILMRLVNEILDFRKIQNKKMELTLSEFELTDYLKEWVSTCESIATKRKIKVELITPAPIRLCADIHKVERICYNLLSNALKYTSEGGSITIKAKSTDETVEICIKDTGKGIAKEDIKHIFDRFYQVRNSNKDGTGIGLAIVKAFTELQGGTAKVESEVGKGSEFTITLPKRVAGDNFQPAEETYTMNDFLDESSAVTDISTENKVSKITSDRQEDKPRVLVIDDNAGIRAYATALLGDEYDVMEASDGSEGLKKAVREVPDVVVCDVMMSGMDGLECCKHLKSDSLTCHIPVILLTAKTLDEHRAEGYAYGADAYLTKPFNGNVLKARIKNLITNRKLMKIVFGNDAQQEPMEAVAQSAESQFVEKFRTIIQGNLGNSDLNVETISHEMGISRAQLYRKIKSITGISPNDIIREARLRRADRLLETTDKSVSEIAYEAGFSSPSYFTKCYREFFGRTPNKKH